MINQLSGRAKALQLKGKGFKAVHALLVSLHFLSLHCSIDISQQYLLSSSTLMICHKKMLTSAAKITQCPIPTSDPVFLPALLKIWSSVQSQPCCLLTVYKGSASNKLNNTLLLDRIPQQSWPSFAEAYLKGDVKAVTQTSRRVVQSKNTLRLSFLQFEHCYRFGVLEVSAKKKNSQTDVNSEKTLFWML